MDLLLACVFLLMTTSGQAAQAISVSKTADVVHLAPGTSIDITENVYGSNTLRTYCYPGKPHSLFTLFESVEFQLSIANDDYTEYGGRSPAEVMQHYQEQRSLFSFTLFSQKRKRVQMSPYEPQCLGVSSRQPYNVSLNQLPVDMWRLLQMALGILIFWSSRRLAQNSVFYYLAGMVLGISASLLLVVGLVSKLFPRRPMMVGFLVGGWTIGFYVLKQLMDNMRVILVTYREYVLWYLFITGLISFLICYRFGPPRNPRSQNIIMWVLQAMGGALVYFSSWHNSATIAIMVFTFVVYYFPNSLWQYLCSLYRRRFPQQRRLLTQEEYYQQTVNETAKSLSELREYVNSPQCRQWNMISALRDPLRFASFANGEPHLYDEEIEDYSRTIEESIQDDDEAEDYLACNMYYRPAANRRWEPPHRRHSQQQQAVGQRQQPASYASNNSLRREPQQPQESSDSEEDDEEFMEQE